MRTSRHRFSGWTRRIAVSWALLAAALLATAVAQAASIFEFDGWMQRIEKRALSLQKSLDKPDGAPGAAADAREIEELYRAMEGYFELMGDAPRAVELSRKGRTDAGDLAARATANDVQGARAIVKTMMEDCRTCHREYKPLS
ncbi:MAG: hypothetical protein WDO56_08785 [Gammaproteobacteria bacterium]